MKLNWIVKAIFAGIAQGLAQSAIEKRLSDDEESPAKRPKGKRMAKK